MNWRLPGDAGRYRSRRMHPWKAPPCRVFFLLEFLGVLHCHQFLLQLTCLSLVSSVLTSVGNQINKGLRGMCWGWERACKSGFIWRSNFSCSLLLSELSLPVSFGMTTLVCLRTNKLHLILLNRNHFQLKVGSQEEVEAPQHAY